MSIEVKIKELIENIITENGYILDEVKYEKEKNINFLRVIIDKQGIMDVEDCVVVSNRRKLYFRCMFKRER